VTCDTLDSVNLTALPELPKNTVFDLAGGNFIKRMENVICRKQWDGENIHRHSARNSGHRRGLPCKIRTGRESGPGTLLGQSGVPPPCYLKGWQKIDLVIADELRYTGLGAWRFASLSVLS